MAVKKEKTEKMECIFKCILDLTKQLEALEKIPKKYGTRELLYYSEINTIATIGEQPGINVTALAKKMNVTKGAVSQIIAKLEKKKLIKRSYEKDNDKVVLLKLTSKGSKAFQGREEYRNEILMGIKGYFEGVSEKNSNFLIKSLEEVINCSKDLYEKYSSK